MVVDCFASVQVAEYVAKDVCDILELSNITEALRPLDEDEKSNLRISEVAQNGGRAPIIISEPGLYKLIMRSRKPEAKEFQRWVTHEVLPFRVLPHTTCYSVSQRHKTPTIHRKEKTMNTNIQTYDFKGNQVRTLTDEAGEPWFVAKDVCDILGLENSRKATADLDSDEKNTVTISNGIAGNPNKTIISEAGLYRLIMRSRKPEAKDFQRWVTHEVLPSIRKHGGYMMGQENMTPEQMTLAAMRWLQSKVDEQQKQLEAQHAEIEAQKPKVLFADAVGASDGTVLIGQLAKMLRQNGVNIGQNRLFQRLRDEGYLGTTGQNRNVPTQKAMNLGLFRTKETAITHSDGHITLSITTKVTGKGQRYFIDKYSKEFLR